MNLITSFTSDANQNVSISLNDGSLVSMTMIYRSNQQGWFYSLTYNSMSFNNRRLIVSPNMLRQFRNIIPFGLSCVSSDGYEPGYITDFTAGRISIYSLSSSEVNDAETLITRTIPGLVGQILN